MGKDCSEHGLPPKRLRVIKIVLRTEVQSSIFVVAVAVVVVAVAVVLVVGMAF